MEKRKFSYGRLFLAMLALSAFTFGGGYVIVSLMHRKFVDEYGWIDGDELLNLISIAQAAPGPIAINAAILVGHHLGGTRGFLCSVTATALPPLITLSLVSLAYDAFRHNALISAILRTMQAGVAAIIADVTISLGLRVTKEKSLLSILLMAGAFVATYFFGVNVAFIILFCGVVGAVRTFVARRGEKAE